MLCIDEDDTRMRINILILLLVTASASAEMMTGKVVRIVDGDTVVFLDQGNVQHRVRLAGIDTPERGQPFGKRATEHLARLAGNKPARLEWGKKDRYKRIIGKVWVSPSDGPLTLDVALAQLTVGLAWHYKRYAHEQSEEDRERYAYAEEEAQARGVGLWGDPNPVAPWDWRRGNR